MRSHSTCDSNTIIENSNPQEFHYDWSDDEEWKGKQVRIEGGA